MSAPHFDTEHVTVWHGDCIDVMRDLPDASIDAVVTDPPYGINFMGKDWDTPAAMLILNALSAYRWVLLGQTGKDDGRIHDLSARIIWRDGPA